MSGANEYPFAGDLTDDRVSGLLHSTLERLLDFISLEQHLHNQRQRGGTGGRFLFPPGDSLH